MDLSAKLAVLEKIYEVYDEFTASLDLACKKGCAHCCTTSVILTTVEGYKIFKALVSEGNSWWNDRVLPASAHPRFQPKITTNQLANLCAEVIEHLDENGCSGNLIDVLGVMASEKNRQTF